MSSKNHGSANPGIAHAEAALGAGRKDENSREGHNQMFDNYSDLTKHNHETYGHNSNKPSRGAEVDAELAREDQERIRQMDHKE